PLATGYHSRLVACISAVVSGNIAGITAGQCLRNTDGEFADYTACASRCHAGGSAWHDSINHHRRRYNARVAAGDDVAHSAAGRMGSSKHYRGKRAVTALCAGHSGRTGRAYAAGDAREQGSVVIRPAGLMLDTITAG